MKLGQIPKIVKPFKYGGKLMKLGFEFIPSGGQRR